MNDSVSEWVSERVSIWGWWKVWILFFLIFYSVVICLLCRTILLVIGYKNIYRVSSMNMNMNMVKMWMNEWKCMIMRFSKFLGYSATILTHAK
jgi:hypothetical protein